MLQYAILQLNCPSGGFDPVPQGYGSVSRVPQKLNGMLGVRIRLYLKAVEGTKGLDKKGQTHRVIIMEKLVRMWELWCVR